MRTISVASFCFLAWGCSLGLAEAPRPNILYFYVDDMGWGSIGPNGQADRKANGLPYVRTPNLDRLAAAGVNFTRGYGCHVCSPARSSQQTGFHQGHTFADRNDPDNAKKAIRSEDITIGDSLSKAGYVTGYWGKWGYGGSKDRQNPTIDNLQTLPTSHGYQHVLAELHHVRAHTFFQPTLWSAPAREGTPGGLALKRNSMAGYSDALKWPGQPALQSHPDYPETAYCDDSYAFAALDFVRQQSQNYNATGQPFFGLLAVQIPHAPFGEISTLPEWDRVYASDPLFAELSDQTKQWAAMVTRIDAHFGNILAALEDPNNDGDVRDSVAGNTLVVFQSDNGGPAGKNNMELNANGGLSGNKGKIQEGGIRVPLVMRWPDKIHQATRPKAGSNSNRVVDVTDLLPTFCELAGVEAPLGIDGVSIAPTLTGHGVQRQREFIIHEASNGNSIIRGRHKLVQPKKRGQWQLFDLERDATESTNIASRHPDLVREMRGLLAAERVDEPKGFSNTYHHWIGGDGDDPAEPDNWSDYTYANAGVVYQQDKGGPQAAWVAKLSNTGPGPQTLEVKDDLEFLALQVSSHKSEVPMSLRIPETKSINGRNEIRLGPNGSVALTGGKISSLRWIDISKEGQLCGWGEVQGDVYCSGSIDLEGKLAVDGAVFLLETSRMKVKATKPPDSLQASGTCHLDGTLDLHVPQLHSFKSGDNFTIIEAQGITGRFDNKNNEVDAGNGLKFAISYAQSSVKLTAK